MCQLLKSKDIVSNRVAKVEKVSKDEMLNLNLEDSLKKGDLVQVEPFSSSSYLGVNLTGYTRNVYSSSSGGSIIGNLSNKECFTFIDGPINGRMKIQFLNASGQYVTGYIKSESGMTYWKDKYLGGVTTNDRLGGNFRAVTYKVVRNTTVYSGDKQYKFAVTAGNYILCKAGYQGKTGSSEKTWMLCHAIRWTNSNKDEIISNWYFSGSGYVDCGIKNSGSATPRVRGNW